INADGTGYTNIYQFAATQNGINSGGAHPVAGVLVSSTTIYGVASQGGTYGYGTVFKVSTSGTGFTTLFNFDGVTNGAYPRGGLVLSGSTLYGTTYGSDAAGHGHVFKINTDGTGF